MDRHADHPPQPPAASSVGSRRCQDLLSLSKPGTARRIVIIRNGQFVGARAQRRLRRRGATQGVPSR